MPDGVVQSQSSLHKKNDERPPAVVSLYYWCYALHAVLFILQVVLLAMLWRHPERKVTLAFDNSTLTTGLSAFLQAFYTLYAALLVFLTQRLALSGFLSCPQKLTTIHDVSGAWGGLGASVTALWRQTNIAASTRATLAIFVYLLSVSVLHVASPTVMEFEPYTASVSMGVLANSTWPDSSVNLSSLNMGLAGDLLSFIPVLSGLSTDGLSNSTLYDTFNKTPQMINASVNSHTIRANCGLLQNLSYTIGADSIVNVNASTDGIGQVSLVINALSLTPNEVLFLDQLQNNALLYMASTAMQMNSSVGHNVSIDIVWDQVFVQGSPDRNTSATVYIVACALEASSYTTNLDIQSGSLESTMVQPDAPSQAWSLWTPHKSSLGTQLDLMVFSANRNTQCIDICYGNDTLDDHLMTLLGIRQLNHTASNTTAITLTPYQLENALSQMAAQLIWIAGQLTEEQGGFAVTESLVQVTEQVPRWRLNINTIPVIFTLITSFILLVTMSLMLGSPSKMKKDSPSVKGTTMLEILWIGAHFKAIHNRLDMNNCPSPEVLRPAGMFDVCLAKGEDGTVAEATSLLGPELETSVEYKDIMHARTCAVKDPQSVRLLVNAPSFIKSRHLWCYLLHGCFVLLHAVLLLLLIRHPERHVIVQSDSEVPTTALAASLQFFYIVYTIILVFLTQQLAVSRAMARIQNLTSMHDLSQAWTGVGSSLLGVWQQVKVPASLSTTLAITTYYLCVSVLHITSTTIIQFEVFESSRNHTVQSALSWPASGYAGYDWSALGQVVPLDQLPNFPAKGLANSTVYDTPTVDSATVNATVNATTIQANCGLLSGLSDDLAFTNLTVPTLGPVGVNPMPRLWKDTVQFLGAQFLRNGDNLSLMCSGCDNYLIYWVTTALEVDASLSEAVNVSVNTIWHYTPLGGNETYSNTTVYVVACSLNATTTVGVVDAKNDALISGGLAQSAEASQRSWSIWSPIGSIPSLGSEISSALNNANGINSMVVYPPLTNMDVYTMSLLGINFTEISAVSVTQSSADPSVTLSPVQFEEAISQIAAQYVWAAGHTNGAFGPVYGSGESVVMDLVVMRRLNINVIPAAIAFAASLALFVLAGCMVGITPRTPSPLSELGVLETLWLEAHSDVLHDRMGEVEEPTLHNLRVAGMFGVCLADEVREVLDGAAE